MNLDPMKLFLSEDNIKNHLEHLHTQKLKLSILEKSVPLLPGKSISEILGLKIDAQSKGDAIRLIKSIKSHESFFNSFTENPIRCKRIEAYYSSKEEFLYDILMMGKDNEYGFIYVFNDRQGKPQIVHSSKNEGAYIKFEPILAIDLYEHTYFNDYGFNREKFLRNALPYLNTGALE